VRLDWMGVGLRFRGGGTDPETPAVELDGDGATGPSPMLVLLLAAAGCSGADVVAILSKLKVRLDACAVDVSGIRREGHPKRYASLKFVFHLSGDGLDRAKAERAVGLSLKKYCSVVHSLARDIKIEHEIKLT
jgi:putative redox protein